MKSSIVAVVLAAAVVAGCDKKEEPKVEAPAAAPAPVAAPAPAPAPADAAKPAEEAKK